MYDSIDINAIPASALYVAGYVAGSWPTYNQLLKDFPHATVLSIAPQAAYAAECLDVEPYDATNAQVPAWVKHQLAAKVWRPVIYSSASNMNAVIDELTSAGISIAQVRLWSAHYNGEHICGPHTCGYVKVACDGTQWTDNALGRNLDQSLLVDSFFSPPKPPVPTPPVPDWEVKMMNALPVLSLNANSVFVKRAQALLNVDHAYGLKVDGLFGPATKIALDDFQKRHNIPVTGQVDSATWPVLVTGAK